MRFQLLKRKLDVKESISSGSKAVARRRLIKPVMEEIADMFISHI
jgi:hypothetical protein